jgi:aminoglycoside 2'-N-acetyltransferase I
MWRRSGCGGHGCIRRIAPLRLAGFRHNLERAGGGSQMSIEIELLSGDASWPVAAPLFNAVWPPEVVATLPWANIAFAHAELRVLVEDETEGLVCHVGIYRREATWNGRAVRIGGIGGVLTHEAFRRRGLASIALNAAIQTLKDERATDFALLFCEPHNAAFYCNRGWKPFAGEVFAQQPGGRIRFDVLTPLVFYLKRAPHEGVIDLCGLPW